MTSEDRALIRALVQGIPAFLVAFSVAFWMRFNEPVWEALPGLLFVAEGF